ncbi:MAG: hypothetical protein E7260_03780 [Lachnospiraceae bacterium]|nr:hypothetical protein [Lachnospiraceae bacterium]
MCKLAIFNYFLGFIILNVESEVSSMAKNGKQTSRRVASTASKILHDGRYGKDSKSVAASALSQTKPRGKK